LYWINRQVFGRVNLTLNLTVLCTL